MKTYVTLLNTTQRELPVIFQGTRYALTPTGTEGASMPVSEACAKLFLEHYGTDVRIIDEASAEAYEMPIVDKGTVWLANITGNPDAPKQIVHSYVTEGEKKGQAIMGPNPDAVPHNVTVFCYAGGGQKITKTMDGSRACFTTRKKAFTIRPFERKELPAVIADQFRIRVYNQQPDQTPAVIRSRPPTSFEPSMKWPYEQLRYWIMQTHPEGSDKAIHGPTEQEIYADCVDEDERPMRLHKAKYELWKRSFVLCANPETVLPTQSQFEKFVEKQLKAEAKKTKRENVASATA